ncbi:MAG: hypothetical protein J6Q68_00670 [Clostridia bacterium]|nr:hypothetical protein [Clostridia bacterium]
MRRNSKLNNFAERFASSNFFGCYDVKGISAKNARAFSSGGAARAIRFISRLLAYTPMRVYGFAALTFGLLTIVLHLGEYYFLDNPQVEAASLILGAAFSLLSIFLLISDKPICIALQSFKVTDFIFFEFFLIGRMRKKTDERGLPMILGIAFGFLLAVIGFFAPTLYVSLVVLGILFASIAMISPEFCFISSILISPYATLIPHSSGRLAALSILTLLSFARKVVVGKRVYSVEIYDVLILLLTVAVLLAGVVLGGGASTEPALGIICLLLGYIPAANLAVNRRLCDAIVAAVVISSIPSALYAAVSYVVRLVQNSRSASLAWFSSVEALSAYLCVALIISTYMFFEKRHKFKKVLCLFAAFVNALALISTQHLELTVAFPIVLLAFVIIRSKRMPKILLLALLLIPYAILFLPSGALDVISKYLHASPNLSEISESVIKSAELFRDNFLLGIGANPLGEAACGTYLSVACRFGIISAVVLFLIVLMRIIHLNAYTRFFSSTLVGFHVEMAVLAPLAMLLIGSYANIFEDLNMVYFFVVIFGMGSAAMRISRKERDLLGSYYRDSRSISSSAIDINLK